MDIARLVRTAVEADELLAALLAPEGVRHDGLGRVEADPDPVSKVARQRPDALRRPNSSGAQELLDDERGRVGGDDRIGGDGVVGDALKGALTVAGRNGVDPDLAARLGGSPELAPAPRVHDLGRLVVQKPAALSPLSLRSIHKILERYRRQRKARRC